jgi:hypothetical protein
LDKDEPIEKASTYKGQQHKKMSTNLHALSGIQTHDISVQEVKAYASDGSATGAGKIMEYKHKIVMMPAS